MQHVAEQCQTRHQKDNTNELGIETCRKPRNTCPKSTSFAKNRLPKDQVLEPLPHQPSSQKGSKNHHHPSTSALRLLNRTTPTRKTSLWRMHDRRWLNHRNVSNMLPNRPNIHRIPNLAQPRLLRIQDVPIRPPVRRLNLNPPMLLRVRSVLIDVHNHAARNKPPQPSRFPPPRDPKLNKADDDQPH